MPSKSKKSMAQAAKLTALPCRKSPATVNSGASLDSCDFGFQHNQNQQKGPAGTHVHQARQRTFADVLVEGPQVMLRSASQKSVSTDEGSSSSGCSMGSPANSEGPVKLCSNQVLCSPSAQEVCHQTPMDLPAHVCTPHAPLWVDNGLQGDKGAWLLVMPKFELLSGSYAASGLMDKLKSPSDAFILGPYVTTKNTFLDESRVGGALRYHQQVRSKSWDACRSCMTSP